MERKKWERRKKKFEAAGVWLLEMAVCRNQSKWNSAAKKYGDRPTVWCWGREKDGAKHGGGGNGEADHMRGFR